MYCIDVHEEFPAGFSRCGRSVSSAWGDAVTELGSWTTFSTGNNVGVFGPDQIAVASRAGVDQPDPQCPGKPVAGYCVSDPVPQALLSPQANAVASQFIFVGSRDVNALGKYFTAAPNRQVRYTDHGRDEVGTWVCPVQ
jgi:hypothetical protein